jgi:hypothetical protein
MFAFAYQITLISQKKSTKETQEYTVPKKELLLEIDFYGDAPALRNEFGLVGVCFL